MLLDSSWCSTSPSLLLHNHLFPPSSHVFHTSPPPLYILRQITFARSHCCLPVPNQNHGDRISMCTQFILDVSKCNIFYEPSHNVFCWHWLVILFHFWQYHLINVLCGKQMRFRWCSTTLRLSLNDIYLRSLWRKSYLCQWAPQTRQEIIDRWQPAN